MVPIEGCKQSTNTICKVVQLVLLVVNLIVISFCKTIYFVTLACFSVVLIYPDSLFSYFTIIILSVMTAVTFPLRPPRLAFANCERRWQNDVHEIKKKKISPILDSTRHHWHCNWKVTLNILLFIYFVFQFESQCCMLKQEKMIFSWLKPMIE